MFPRIISAGICQAIGLADNNHLIRAYLAAVGSLLGGFVVPYDQLPGRIERDNGNYPPNAVQDRLRCCSSYLKLFDLNVTAHACVLLHCGKDTRRLPAVGFPRGPTMRIRLLGENVFRC